MKNIFFLVSCLLVLSGNAVAETRYVSDTLEITMRSGKGTSFGITRMLRSGTPVEVLNVDKKSGYTQVRTNSGKEGWVLSRFLMKGQAARDRRRRSRHGPVGHTRYGLAVLRTGCDSWR